MWKIAELIGEGEETEQQLSGKVATSTFRCGSGEVAGKGQSRRLELLRGRSQINSNEREERFNQRWRETKRRSDQRGGARNEASLGSRDEPQESASCDLCPTNQLTAAGAVRLLRVCQPYEILTQLKSVGSVRPSFPPPPAGAPLLCFPTKVFFSFP